MSKVTHDLIRDLIRDLIAVALWNDGWVVDEEHRLELEDGRPGYADIVVWQRGKATPAAVIEVKERLLHESRVRSAVAQAVRYADALESRWGRPLPIVAGGSVGVEFFGPTGGALVEHATSVASGLRELIDSEVAA